MINNFCLFFPLEMGKSTTLKKDKEESGNANLADKLAELDPDFCDFLKDEDQELLNELKNETDSGSDFEMGDEDAEESDDDDEIAKKLDAEGSDDEDLESDEESDLDVVSSGDEEDEVGAEMAGSMGLKILTMGMIKEWSTELEELLNGNSTEAKARKAIDQVVSSLRCAADKMMPAKGKEKKKGDKKKRGNDASDSEGEGKPKEKKKKSASLAKLFDHVGAKEFNAVVKLCISRLVPSFITLLENGKKVDKKTTMMQRAHQLRCSEVWGRLKLSLRVYIETVVDLIKYSTDEQVSSELVAHLNTDDSQLLVFAVPSVRKSLIQTVVSIWSKGHLVVSKELIEQCQGLIINMVQHCPPAKFGVLYERVFRRLYRAYMSACKFSAKNSSENAEQSIELMKNHLAKFVLIAPNPATSHALAFVKTRHLCAQLRAAMSAATSEGRQKASKIVLSWPFLRCIDLWIEVVCRSPSDHTVQQLAYPLSQLTIGTARLQNSPRFYPLRFHCIRYLNRLAKNTDCFIPIVPLILDIFTMTDFNVAASTKGVAKGEQRKVVSLKGLLHFAESHLRDSGAEGGMLDAVVHDLVYYATAETLAAYSHRVAFPEMVLALLVRLRKFVKVCFHFYTVEGFFSTFQRCIGLSRSSLCRSFEKLTCQDRRKCEMD